MIEPHSALIFSFLSIADESYLLCRYEVLYLELFTIQFIIAITNMLASLFNDYVTFRTSPSASMALSSTGGAAAVA